MQLFKITTMLMIGFLPGCDSSQIENGENNIQSASSLPLTIVFKDLGSIFQETPSTLLIKQTVSGDSIESPDRVTVTLEEDTPTDDSIAAIRYRYQLSKTNDIWKIDSRDITQRCASGRGSPDFSKELCQ